MILFDRFISVGREKLLDILGKESLRHIGSMTQVYSSVRQSELPGYPGCQCTTVALTAILHWELERRQGRRPQQPPWSTKLCTPETGCIHCLDVFKLSVEVDNRVAIDDLPLDRYLTLCNVFSQSQVAVKRSDTKYVCTSEMKTFGTDIMPLKEMLANAALPSAFLVTCGDLSHAIFKRDDFYELFDSHGFVKIYKGHKVKSRGSIFRFSSVTELDEFIVSVHGKGAYMQVAELTVRPEREEKLRLTQVVKGDGYEPHVPIPVPQER